MFDVTVKAFLVLLFTNGIRSLLEQAGVVIGGWVAVAVAALVTAFVSFAEAVVVALPQPWQGLIIGILTLLAGAGLFKTAKILGTAKPS